MYCHATSGSQIKENSAFAHHCNSGSAACLDAGLGNLIWTGVYLFAVTFVKLRVGDTAQHSLSEFS